MEIWSGSLFILALGSNLPIGCSLFWQNIRLVFVAMKFPELSGAKPSGHRGHSRSFSRPTFMAPIMRRLFQDFAIDA
jgi:hypothetical protein